MPVLGVAFILGSCGGSKTETTASETKAAQVTHDEPVFIADGSARLLFALNVYPIDKITQVYGCCLSSPAAGGEKELRVYQPDGGAMKQTKKVILAEIDVVDVYLEKKSGDGWAAYDGSKFPSPQLALYRRDMTRWLSDAAITADYAKTGKKGWVVASDKMPRQDEKLLTNADFVKATGARKEYALAAGKDVRLGKLIIRHANQVEEDVPVASGCTVIEICTAGNCAKETRNPCVH